MTASWDPDTLPSEATEFSFPDIWTATSWEFDSASGRVTFTGNVLKTTHIVGRKKDFRMMLVLGPVPNFIY